MPETGKICRSRSNNNNKKTRIHTPTIYQPLDKKGYFRAGKPKIIAALTNRAATRKRWPRIPGLPNKRNGGLPSGCPHHPSRIMYETTRILAIAIAIIATVTTTVAPSSVPESKNETSVVIGMQAYFADNTWIKTNRRNFPPAIGSRSLGLSP